MSGRWRVYSEADAKIPHARPKMADEASARQIATAWKATSASTAHQRGGDHGRRRHPPATGFSRERPFAEVCESLQQSSLHLASPGP